MNATGRCGLCPDCCHRDPQWCDAWGDPPPEVAARIARRDAFDERLGFRTETTPGRLPGERGSLNRPGRYPAARIARAYDVPPHLVDSRFPRPTPVRDYARGAAVGFGLAAIVFGVCALGYRIGQHLATRPPIDLIVAAVAIGGGLALLIPARARRRTTQEK